MRKAKEAKGKGAEGNALCRPLNELFEGLLLPFSLCRSSCLLCRRTE